MLFFLLLILGGLRLVLNNPFAMSHQPLAEKGVLDLRGIEFDERHTLDLKGDWEFYPQQFIYSDSKDRISEEPTYLHVPGTWKYAMLPNTTSAKGYGSYKLRILTDPSDFSYKLLIKEITNSFKLYANGNLEAQMGQISKTAEKHNPDVMTKLVSLPNTTEIELIVEVSNFENPFRGGISRSIKFGPAHAIHSERTYNVGMQLMTIVVLMLHAVYIGIIYFFSRNNKIFLTFTLLLIAAMCSISLDEDKVLLSLLPLDYEMVKRVSLISYLLMMGFMLQLTISFCTPPNKRKYYRAYFIPAFVFGVFVLVAPIHWVLLMANTGPFSVLVLFPSVFVPFLLTRYVIQKDRSAVFLLIAASSIASTLIWGGFKGRGMADSGFYAFDILIALLSAAAYGIWRYFQNNEALTDVAARLQKANDTKADFLANTSHELRTPLHGMINMADSVLAAEGDTLSERSRKDLQLLGQVGRRMNVLLGDLLDVSQLRENRLSIRPEPVKVQSMAAGVLDMLRYMAAGKPIELKLDIPSGFPSVYADEKRLTQILFNLVHNAIKFTSSGTVTVRAEIVGDSAAIQIADTGIGIAEKELVRIFSPYEQGDSLRKAAGIGLGLTVSRSLLELHGSELKAESEPSKGSVFSFSLPLAEVSIQEANPMEEQAVYPEFALAFDEDADIRRIAGMPGGNYELSMPSHPAVRHLNDSQNGAEAWDEDSDSRAHVLAVDDDPINLRVLRSMLAEEHYLVTSVLSGEEALELLENQAWDLVIADVMMPNMSGYELSARIRERYSRAELPILLLTARNRPEDIYAGFAAGANDYLTKPADALELNYRVKALTDLKRALSEHLSMEAAYLQAQIQPHFLFNALNSITALSGIDIDRMNETIEAFGSYLKISFDYWNARQLVPLERELELVRSYLYIESMRFEDRLRVDVTISEEIDPEATMLPPLCIQPLVENAVRHGVLSRSKGGCVSLNAAVENGKIVFTVHDDGVGMDEKTLQSLLLPDCSERRGIGTRNTDRRLKRMYGSGLSIHSRLGIGTTVSFQIPAAPLQSPLYGMASD
ncbi:hypothetical protein GCM10010969_16020 [Saccharibacillus kuerlensis]|uniref:histidine kinase n=2 Tax=Saccharibacillus kuerlensis TaxID=459527 RepID=A0ABQ2KZB5_9BACL|nr:hypothetical protein GCM10010969_16020 [Saccharibacillus kuerlensis]